MTGMATASLLAFSSAACPPRLKMPTLYPVFPRFRVGMEPKIAGFERAGFGGAGDWPPATLGSAAEPSAAAVMMPPALRNCRRLFFDCSSDLTLRTMASDDRSALD